MKNYVFFLFTFLLVGCVEQLTQDESLKNSIQSDSLKFTDFITRNNLVHNKKGFQHKTVITADIELVFGGKLRLDANLMYHTKTGKTKITYKDSSELTFNGENVYFSPASLEKPSARFDIFTWSYFLALPYKIDDKGTTLSDFQNKDLNGKTFNVEKLTLVENIGDSPDDWYVLYQKIKKQIYFTLHPTL